jgi:hypothetical protein
VLRPCTLLGLALMVFAPRGAAADERAELDFFESKIRPVLVRECYACHSARADNVEGGLRLDTREGVLKGGDSGPAVVPAAPGESLLISAIRYESHEMPPTRRLPDEVVRDFERWVAGGAVDPRTGDPQATADPVENHWAFQPRQVVEPPEVKQGDWVCDDIDRFVAARLEANGLTPGPMASPRVLVRRLYYDLTGLPPTFEQAEEFARDPSAEKYAALVEQLLASPQFGEHWGRHWLDIARYADTKGYVFQEDRNYKGAYKYRDWVIASFNGDLPYDQFVTQQLTSDLTESTDDDAASGFLTLGRRFLNNRHDIIDDRIDLVTRGLMGMTVACSRCHDHKYDPIPTSDYYALYGVFASTKEENPEEMPPRLVEDSPHDVPVFLRGQAGNHGPIAPRRFLDCLVEGTPEPFKQGSGRAELAAAIVDPANPVTARVWVNRVWGHLLGKPIVATQSDFGTRGELPTHPELLDHLAERFVKEGWSTKKLIRSIVLSATYTQSSDPRSDCVAVDPENRLLWRANRKRLGLESMRDSLLVAAGSLDATQGGPSVDLLSQPFSPRRSVYGFIERQNLPNYFRTFDFASPDSPAAVRPTTVTPQQSLYFLNSPFVIEQAQKLAERTASLADPGERVKQMFRLTYGREPQVDELTECVAFATTADPKRRRRHLDSWTQLAQALVMSNEILFVD